MPRFLRLILFICVHDLPKILNRKKPKYNPDLLDQGSVDEGMQQNFFNLCREKFNNTFKIWIAEELFQSWIGLFYHIEIYLKYRWTKFEGRNKKPLKFDFWKLLNFQVLSFFVVINCYQPQNRKAQIFKKKSFLSDQNCFQLVNIE